MNLAGESAARAAAPRVLLVDADPALHELLEEWLSAQGCTVVQRRRDGVPARYDLIVVDVPFPRQHGNERLKRIASENPGTPIVAISSSFFAGVETSGAVARSLGVASVLAKPVARGALIDTVERLLLRTQ